MKKVFALLSVIALTFALVGFVPKVSADDSKWTEDPTLTENDIPMYIMNSIYTTFPNFYDNAAKPDGAWAGAARMYPWNETRLQVKQISATGQYTGKEYAIFFSGGTTAAASGAGNNIMLIDKKEDGTHGLFRTDGGIVKASTGAMDPSLSHLTTNISDTDATFDATTFGWDSSQAGNYYNRMMVFDAQGRMIRGLAGDIAYQDPSKDGAIVGDAGPVVIPAEFCYVNGAVTKIEDGVVCDKIKVEKLDEEGNPELDDEGNPVMVDTDQDNKLYQRFMFQWFAEKPEVNEVAYLAEGWDAQKWDYAWEDEGGWLAIAFVSSEGSLVKLRPEQLEVYNKTLEARGESPVDASAYRKMCRMITVPAGGFMYDFGYLDKGINEMYVKYIDMFMGGYKYGRKLDANGKGMAYEATFNFSAKPLYVVNADYDGAAYVPLEDRAVIEVKAGSVIKPTKNVVYTGLARYWAVENDLTSFKSDTKVVKLEVSVNGEAVVYPDRYESFDAMKADLLNDFNGFMANKNGYKLEDGKWMKDGAEWVAIDPTPEASFATGAAFYSRANNEFATTNASYKSFFADKAMRTKWSWLIAFMNNEMAKAGQTDSVSLTNGVLAGSPGNFTATMWCFLKQWEAKPTWPSSKVDWKALGTAFLKAPYSWDSLEVATEGLPVDKNIDVVFKAENVETGIKSELKLTYVVVDEYTPVLKVNKDATLITPRVENGKVIIPEIDKYAFCSAQNGPSNGAVVADNISFKVAYESATLDFENPTEGNHVVKATVSNKFKSVTKVFTVKIEDLTAPLAFTRDITLPYGADFDVTMGITYAVDAVDGDLRSGGVRRNWCVDDSAIPVDTTKPGNYRVKAIVYDKAGNEKAVSYNVTVVDTRSSNAEIEKDIKGIKADLADLILQVEELLEGGSDTPAALAGCGQAPAAVFVNLLAATSLLFVFLKKKH